ncbi:MAG: aminotransferase class V-fold PLP-dependent enzyme [Deltaproteobacteria bacterium]|nr:aminotransferase class V-fold PLP-dependent enzyme [Deltaproteobacteria bacterium]
MIYLDNNATTRLLPEVLAAMMPYFGELYGNPSSIHLFAEQSREALRQSRVAVGRLIGSRPEEIVFTSGATEACNLAIFGAAAARPERRHIVVSSVEHHAVLHPIERLRAQGYEVTVLPVSSSGGLTAAEVAAALRDDTLLVATMLANNETGVIFPVAEIAAAAKARGALLLCDATQAVGKMPVHARRLGVDYLALSAHKFHGPKGVGALAVRRGAPIVAQLVGGGQQWDIRSGTENVPGIVGMGMASYLARRRLEEGAYGAVEALRDRLEQAILANIERVVVNGGGEPRLPTTLNVSFEDSSGEAMLQLLDEVEIAASSSSACQSNVKEPSHVLTALGLSERYLHGSVRFGLSLLTTDDEVDELLARLPRIVARGRAASTERSASE